MKQCVSIIACLNMFHQNHNKSVILDASIDVILQHERKDYSSEYKISSGKFRKLWNGLMGISLAYSIDPPENLFVENVMIAMDINGLIMGNCNDNLGVSRAYFI